MVVAPFLEIANRSNHDWRTKDISIFGRIKELVA